LPDVELHENVTASDFKITFPRLVIQRNINYENVRGGRGRKEFIMGFTQNEKFERDVTYPGLPSLFIESRPFTGCLRF